MRLELFPFRFRDPVTRKWVRARYVAERHVIAERYAEWEIIGPPEIRDADPEAAHFNPYTNRAAVGNVGAVIAVGRSAIGKSRQVVVAGIAS